MTEISQFSGLQSPQENRYNPKVIQRKLEMESEWAQLAKHNQIANEKLKENEKEHRRLAQKDISDLLSQIMQQKDMEKKREQTIKQMDYQDSVARKQNYDKYVEKLKQDKLNVQHQLSEDYQKKFELQQQERKARFERDRQFESNMIRDALDSLEREKIEKERKMQDYKDSVKRLQATKDVQKQREQEQSKKEKETYNTMLQHNMRNQELKDESYKSYFQKVNENQHQRQMLMEDSVITKLREKDRQIDGFINKGIEETLKKQKEEELERMKRKLDLQRSVSESHQTMLAHKEQQQQGRKLEYFEKAGKLIQEIHDNQIQSNAEKRSKFEKQKEYMQVLERQLKEREDSLKRQVLMSDKEKSLHLTPSQFASPRSELNSLLSPQQINRQQIFVNPSNDVSSSELDLKSYLTPKRDLSYQPGSRNAPLGVYNPITNPISNNLQNPYLIKEVQDGKGLPHRKNIFAVVGNAQL